MRRCGGVALTLAAKGHVILCMRLTQTFSAVRAVEHPFPPCSCAENDSIFLNTRCLALVRMQMYIIVYDYSFSYLSHELGRAYESIGPKMELLNDV